MLVQGAAAGCLRQGVFWSVGAAGVAAGCRCLVRGLALLSGAYADAFFSYMNTLPLPSRHCHQHYIGIVIAAI